MAQHRSKHGKGKRKRHYQQNDNKKKICSEISAESYFKKQARIIASMKDVAGTARKMRERRKDADSAAESEKRDG